MEALKPSQEMFGSPNTDPHKVFGRLGVEIQLGLVDWKSSHDYLTTGGRIAPFAKGGLALGIFLKGRITAISPLIGVKNKSVKSISFWPFIGVPCKSNVQGSSEN